MDFIMGQVDGINRSYFAKQYMSEDKLYIVTAACFEKKNSIHNHQVR